MTGVPLTIIAHLATAYSASDPWSPAIDAILAYWALREQLGEEEFVLGFTGHRALVDPGLPLVRDEWNEHWWYCASSPIVDIRAVGERYYHRRFDDEYGEKYLPAKTQKVLTVGGPYKASRSRAPLIVAPTITWHVLAEQSFAKGEIERLLRRCGNIGFGYTKGYGRVDQWEVREGDDEAVRLARFHRPLPVAVAAAHGIEGPEMEWGIRPPGRVPAHRTRCVMPPLMPAEALR